MKTNKYILVIFLLALTCGNLEAQTFWSNNRVTFVDTSPVGNTETNPIIIGNAGQLAELAWRVRNGNTYSGRYIRVTKGIAIDLVAHFWDIPIGTSSTRPFQGKFDGNGCTIQNVYMGVLNTILGSVGNCYGLFGYTETGAEIKNVTVEKIVVEEEVTNGPVDTNIQFYSSFIGIARNSTVKNCTVKNFALSTGSYGFYSAKDYGGFIANAYNTTIEDCSASGSVNAPEDAREYVGGFIGKTSGTTTEIKRCSFSGTVITTGNVRAGGFAGSMEGTVKFEQCFFEGEIKTVVAGWGGSTGGFIGYISSGTATILNCTSTGKISGQRSVGGFIGEAGSSGSGIYSNVTITGCRVSGSVIGFENYIGGFAGYFSGRGSFENCLVEAPVLGFSYRVGGFFGDFSGGGGAMSISNCRATGAVEGHDDSTGGFAGFLSGTTSASSIITNCFAEGPVTGQNTVGGFAAFTSSFTFSSCASYGDVKGTDNVGGFIGSSGIGVTITECYTLGHVAGINYIGGFAGRVNTTIAVPINISDSYTVNRVKGNDRVGGFVGSIVGLTNTNFTRCFTSSTIFCENPDVTKLVGGFVGENIKGTFTNCYFDRQMAEVAVASGTPNVTGITGLATSEMTKNLLTGFLKNKWVITTGYYPRLSVFAGSSADETTRLRSALSVVPLKLANDTETVGDVQTIFSVADKTPTGEAMIWIADPTEKVEVKNRAVYWLPFDEWRTLTLRVGKIERSVQFRSVKNVVTTNLIVTADIPPVYNSDLGKYTFTIGCTEKELATTSVFVQISAGGFAKINPDIAGMTLFANQPPQTVTVTDSTHQTKTYTFEAKKSLPPDIFVQRWTDVLAINNNIYTNGGYNFTGYKWYKDGSEITAAKGKGYIQESGGLKPASKYTAVLTSQGNDLTTCPAVINTNAKSQVAVFPNPVQRGQAVRVETSPFFSLPQREGEEGSFPPSGGLRGAGATLFDTAGNIVLKQTLNDPVAEIAMPDMPGQYMLQITINGVSETVKIIVE